MKSRYALSIVMASFSWAALGMKGEVARVSTEQPDLVKTFFGTPVVFMECLDTESKSVKSDTKEMPYLMRKSLIGAARGILKEKTLSSVILKNKDDDRAIIVKESQEPFLLAVYYHFDRYDKDVKAKFIKKADGHISLKNFGVDALAKKETDKEDNWITLTTLVSFPLFEKWVNPKVLSDEELDKEDLKALWQASRS